MRLGSDFRAPLVLYLFFTAMIITTTTIAPPTRAMINNSVGSKNPFGVLDVVVVVLVVSVVVHVQLVVVGVDELLVVSIVVHGQIVVEDDIVDSATV